MLSGYIHNRSNPVQWTPDGKRPARILFTTSKNNITLINRYKVSGIDGYKAEAHYCPECEVVIAPTDKGAE